MDESAFLFLCRSLERRLQRLKAELVTVEDDHTEDDNRGATFARFVTAHLDAAAARLDESAAAYQPATPDEREILGRTVHRLWLLCNSLHEEIYPYRADIGRRDLPVGLLYLIDALINELLQTRADPVVHNDEWPGYSTLRLRDQWQKLSVELGVDFDDDAEPVILFLPGLDAANALLAPILAHEVGHAVAWDTDLEDRLLDQLEPIIDRRLTDAAEALSAAGIPEPEVTEHLQYWLQELLCDALAGALTGPSFLFAAAAFLPAAAAGSGGGTHPDPAYRLGMSLIQLERLGWVPFLERTCPEVFAWVQAAAAARVEAPDVLQEVLGLLVEDAIPELLELAESHIETPMRFDEQYAPVEDELDAMVTLGVPPVQLGGAPTSPWTVILGCWVHGLAKHGAEPVALADAVNDADLNEFALATIGLSRVQTLWDTL